MKYEVRFVEWLDSLGDHGWQAAEEQKRTMRPMHIYTVGFVLDEGDDYVTIMQSVDLREGGPTGGRNHCDNLICIPKFAIQGSRTLQEADV